MNTLLISLGGAGYPNAPMLRHAAFQHSSRAIAGFLTTGAAALLPPENHLNLFDDHRAWPEQLMAIREWLRGMISVDAAPDSVGRIDNVLVHYVGHGMFRPNSEEHYLSINATDAEDRPITSASLGQLNDILLKNARRQRRIYLIDACFAAASLKDLMDTPEDVMEVKIGGILGAWPEGEWGKRGVAALCSADKMATASAGGERDLTQFTDGLMSVLETGDQESPANLSLRRMHQLLRWTLTSRYGDNTVHPVLVAPEDRDGGIAAVPIFPNLAKRQREPAGFGDVPEAVGGEHQPFLPAPEREDTGENSRADIWDKAAADTSSLDRPGSPVGIGSIMLPAAVSCEPRGRSVDPSVAALSEVEAALIPEQRFRQAVYRFFRLPHSKKEEIAKKFDPVTKSSEVLSDLDRYKAALEMVRDSGRLEVVPSVWTVWRLG